MRKSRKGKEGRAEGEGKSGFVSRLHVFGSCTLDRGDGGWERVVPWQRAAASGWTASPRVALLSDSFAGRGARDETGEFE